MSNWTGLSAREYDRLLFGLAVFHAAMYGALLLFGFQRVPVYFNLPSLVIFLIVGARAVRLAEVRSWSEIAKLGFVMRRVIDVGAASLAPMFPHETRWSYLGWAALVLPTILFCVQVVAIARPDSNSWTWRVYL